MNQKIVVSITGIDTGPKYELVIEGEIGYFGVSTAETHWFYAGDFCVIPAEVCVRLLLRGAAGTLAIKVPSAIEKVHCAGCSWECAWRGAPYTEKYS